MSDPKTQEMAPSVAVILVNYNGYDDTVECVQSLCRITYGNYKVFIVDNASADKERLRSDAFLNTHAEIIYAAENGGFSAGNNIAIEKAVAAGFDYVLLLNNDTTVEPDFLDHLVAVAESNRNIGVVTGKIYYYYDRQKLWAAGGDYHRTTGRTNQPWGEDRPELNCEREITFATGCLVLVPSHVVRRVGLLDDMFFLYSEDTDYCQRIIDHGYTMRYTPQAVIYHKVSASTGNGSPLQQRYMMRNNLYMIQRYSPCRLRTYCKMTITMLRAIVRGRRSLTATCQGYVDFVMGRKGKIG